MKSINSISSVLKTENCKPIFANWSDRDSKTSAFLVWKEIFSFYSLKRVNMCFVCNDFLTIYNFTDGKEGIPVISKINSYKSCIKDVAIDERSKNMVILTFDSIEYAYGISEEEISGVKTLIMDQNISTYDFVHGTRLSFINEAIYKDRTVFDISDFTFSLE